jgi:hypothetical protein
MAATGDSISVVSCHLKDEIENDSAMHTAHMAGLRTLATLVLVILNHSASRFTYVIREFSQHIALKGKVMAEPK